MEFFANFTLKVSLTAIIILLFKKIFKNKISAKLHYGIWTILVIRILLSLFGNIEFLNIGSSASIFNMISFDFDDKIIVSEISENLVNDISYNNITTNNNFSNIIYIVWCVIAIVMLIYNLIVYTIFYFRIKSSYSCDDSEKMAIFLKCIEKIEITKDVEVKYFGNSPILIGIFKPMLVIGVYEEKENLEKIFTHELFHLKNNDNLINFIALLILCINWYNPIIWVCYFRFKRDVEIHCDSEVIKILGNKKEYAKLLVETAFNQSLNLPITTSMKNSNSEIKDRIKFLADFKKPNIIWKTLLYICTIFICIGFLTNSKNSLKNPNISTAITTYNISNSELLEGSDTIEEISEPKNVIEYKKGQKFNRQRGKNNKDILYFEKQFTDTETYVIEDITLETNVQQETEVSVIENTAFEITAQQEAYDTTLDIADVETNIAYIQAE